MTPRFAAPWSPEGRSTGGRPVEISIDLDAGPPPASRDRGRRRIVVLVAVLVAAFTGGVVAVATGTSLPAPPPPAAATFLIRSVVLDPAPAAVVVVRAENHGNAPQSLTEIVVGGAGATPARHDVQRRILPGETAQIEVAALLACPVGRTGGAHPEVTVAVGGSDGQGSRPVAAVGVGPPAERGDLCALADEMLPRGWRAPARASGWQFVDGALDVVVTGLPPGATLVAGIVADDVSLPLAPPAVQVHDGSVRLRAEAPAPDCDHRWRRPAVPTGLELTLRSGDGAVHAYVPVGPTLSGWLAENLNRDCPSS